MDDLRAYRLKPPPPAPLAPRLRTVALLIVLSAPAPGAEGDWPMWRRDPSLTAYQPGAGGKQVVLVTSMQQAASDPPPELAPPGSPHVARPASNGRIALWSFDGKDVTRRWSWTPMEFGVEYPDVLVGDLAGDGRP